MLKRLFAALVAMAVSVPAYAGSVSLLSGPQDPSQLQAVINTLILSGNVSWNPAGPSFLTTGTITPISTTTVTVSNLGPAGLTTSTIASWMRIPNPSSTSTNIHPHYYIIPMWGVD